MTEEQKAKKKKEFEDEVVLGLLIAFSNNAEIKAATEGGKVDLSKFPDHVRDEAMQYVNWPEIDQLRKQYYEWIDSQQDGETAPKKLLDLGPFKHNLKAALQALFAKVLAVAHMTDYFEVIGVEDEKQCDACKALKGKIFTMSGNDPRYPKLDKYLVDDGLHPNCRCYVHEIKAPKMTAKDLTTMAMNSANISDEVLYTSLVESDEDNIPTYDFGESLVQIAPVGVFEGTGADGSPYEENITKDALDTVIANYDGSELLLDVDHRSMRGEPKDTKAAGWIYGLKVVDGLGRLDGLYGRIKWTDYGRNLIQTREYRFISPVFKVNDGLPFMLVNAGLTNRPALETIMPILNSKANDGETVIMNEEETKKEDVKEVAEATEAKTEEAQNACGEETKEEKVQNTETTDGVQKETTCNEQQETADKGAECSASEPADTGDSKDDGAEPDDKASEAADKKEEVIKLEVLNQAPAKALQATPADKMKIALSLKGKAFFDYLRANPDLKNM